jgi:starvation-inducible DNA-binding protein
MPDKPVIESLNVLLADATVFYQKLRHYHWNVDGRHFFELHEKFEELYTRWAESIDEIAERVLTIEGVPLHTLASMLEVARLEEDEEIPSGIEMVDSVGSDLAALRESILETVAAAEEVEDRGTANLLDDLLDAIEKDQWMLRSWKKEASRV